MYLVGHSCHSCATQRLSFLRGDLFNKVVSTNVFWRHILANFEIPKISVSCVQYLVLTWILKPLNEGFKVFLWSQSWITEFAAVPSSLLNPSKMNRSHPYMKPKSNTAIGHFSNTTATIWIRLGRFGKSPTTKHHLTTWSIFRETSLFPHKTTNWNTFGHRYRCALLLALMNRVLW